mgnify:CR=1 FL=1
MGPTDPALATALAAAHVTAQAAWPGLAIDAARFAAELVRRSGGALDPDKLAALCTDDVYLAIACLDGEATAIGYLERDAQGVTSVVRLPAEGDPLMERIARIRERDLAVIDTVDSYYANFSDKVEDSYGSFRRVSQQEIEKEDRARASARTRTVLGAAAVLASVLVPNQCASGDYTCRNVQSAARTAGAVGGVAGVMSGIRKYSEAKVHAEALKELSDAFRAEVTPQVIEVEGRTLKLTGTAEEQYREWRGLLQQVYLEETGGVQAVATGPAPAPSPVSRTE